MMMMLHQLHAVNDDDIDDEKNFQWFIDMSVNVPDVDDVDALSLSLFWWCCIENTLLVKGECWNIVTSKNILIIIELLSYRLNPLLWIDDLIMSGLI